ncbi:MAG: hypothetical protein WBC33_01610 [Conexibacter sp.]
MRRALLTCCAAVLASGLAACGADYPDLFVLTRSGSLPGAKLTLLVNDGGTVSCNGGAPRQLPDQLLLDARDIETSLQEEAHDDLVLPASARSLLRYRLRAEEGTVTFSDTDAATRPELGKLVAFTRTVAQDVCGLAR